MNTRDIGYDEIIKKSTEVEDATKVDGFVDRYTLIKKLNIEVAGIKVIFIDPENLYFNRGGEVYKCELKKLGSDNLKSIVSQLKRFNYDFLEKTGLKGDAFGDTLFEMNDTISRIRRMYYRNRKKQYDVSGKLAKSGSIYTDISIKDYSRYNYSKMGIKGVCI